MAIRSICTNEELSTRCRYTDIRTSPTDVGEICGCAVFVGTYPEGEISIRGDRGARRTWLDGYSEPIGFYHPDHSALPKEEDYCRILYWNSEVMSGEAGNAQVRLYNNSRYCRLKIAAEMILTDGATGVFNERYRKRGCLNTSSP